MEGGDLQARSCGYRAIQLRSEATRIGQRFVELWHRDTRWSDKQSRWEHVGSAGVDLLRPIGMHGQAVIAGTRVPVRVLLDCLAAGMTVEEVLAEYPTVGAVGVQAAAAS